jgi:hypothetical protein
MATFGDFLRQAGGHLRDAADRGQDATTDRDTCLRELERVVACLARYLQDRARCDADEAARRTDLRPWDRATSYATAALHQAAACLHPGTPAAPSAEPGERSLPATGLALSLATAARSLTAGRDLLQTHLTTTAEDLEEWNSDWAPTVTSYPITQALAFEITGWAHRLAPIAVALAPVDTLDLRTGVTPDGVREAASWLGAAAATTAPAQAVEPVTTVDIRLLRALPAAHPPQRISPQAAEPVIGLYTGITVSAERLRSSAFATAREATWAPGANASTWRWRARAAAVAGHASELILTTLAGHGDALGAAQVRDAAEATGWSWAAWRDVSTAWASLATDTHGRTPAATTDLSDLVLRLGRLAWNDPGWTPERARGIPMRAAADLAPGPWQLRAVVAAVHQAADALGRVAAADRDAVTLADRVERLYVTTRSLPDGYDVPRLYATAPLDRTEPLLNAYQAAANASARAADALGALALTLDAPSSPLALARAAASPRLADAATAPDLQPAPAASTPAIVGMTITGILAVHTTRPGAVEQALRSMRVSDPIMLVRAAALDATAQALLNQATQPSRPASVPSRSSTAQPHSPSPPRPAQIAANDNPRYPTGPYSSNHPSRPPTRPRRSSPDLRTRRAPRR